MLQTHFQSGQVYWLTGLSGAGKTTLGTLLFQHLRETKPNVVYLDGDTLRQVFGNTQGYTIEERKMLAMRYARLCKIISEQGIDVICATISLFYEVHDWNRTHIPEYIEIYIKVPMDVLIKRDQKQLYSRALRGEVQNIMGIDIPVAEPTRPDIIIENTGEHSPDKLLTELITHLTSRKD
jgi:adenylylsulfate kinase-like enzyme